PTTPLHQHASPTRRSSDLASFTGGAGDNSGGVGLSANSTTFTLQRVSDGLYWTGSAWQAGTFDLATTHNATTGGNTAAWTSSITMPAWASESNGSYTVRMTATDMVGNGFTGGAITFTLDNTTPSPLAVGTVASDSSAETTLSIPANTRQPSELLIGALGIEDQSVQFASLGDSFQALAQGTTGAPATKDNVTAQPTYWVVSSTGTYAASGTMQQPTSRLWAAAIATYRLGPCSAPAVTTNPSNQIVVSGQDATFVAAASGDSPPTVQWQVSTDGGTTWNDIPGATSTTL